MEADMRKNTDLCCIVNTVCDAKTNKNLLYLALLTLPIYDMKWPDAYNFCFVFLVNNNNVPVLKFPIFCFRMRYLESDY